MMKLVCAEALLEAFIAADRGRPPVDAGLTKAEATISAATKLAEWGIGQVELAATTADCEHLEAAVDGYRTAGLRIASVRWEHAVHVADNAGALAAAFARLAAWGATTCVLPVVAVAESTGFDERQLEVIRRLGD
ncbi:MAG: hypothetical protein KDA63_13660, partial [Planctomycetales bacterium]|nr:hypothetical protein [Planctomycetales bacterium]